MTREQGNGTERFWYGLLAVNLLIVVPAVILLVSNTRDVRLKWLGLDANVPLYAVILVAFISGVVVDELVGIVWRWRRRQTRKLRTELDELRRRAGPERAGEDPE